MNAFQLSGRVFNPDTRLNCSIARGTSLNFPSASKSPPPSLASACTTILRNEAAGTGKNPLDLAVTSNGRFLYALDPGSGNVDMFQIGQNGCLTNLGAINGELFL